MPSKVKYGSFTGTATSEHIRPREIGASFEGELMTLSLGGTWTGTVELQRARSVPGEAIGTFEVIDTYTAPVQTNIEAPSDIFLYRLECTIFGTGTIEYTLAA